MAESLAKRVRSSVANARAEAKAIVVDQKFQPSWLHSAALLESPRDGQ